MDYEPQRQIIRALPAFGTAVPELVLRCVCDCCKAEGVLGMPPFLEHGDLLDFTPVPRRLRGDGWLPGLQKLFIAALAITGSRNRAVKAVGKHNAGIENLRLADGAEEFNAAYDRALSLYEERHLALGVRRARALGDGAIAQDYGDVPVGVAGRAAPPPAPVLTAADWAAKRAKLAELLTVKLKAEARLRAAGDIVEANLALRQASRIEVMIELSAATEPATVDAFMDSLRTASGIDELHVVDTPASRASDTARRAAWAEEGTAQHPPPLPAPEDEVGQTGGLKDHGDARTWDAAVRGGPMWQQRDHQRRVALIKRAFDGERE